MELLFDVARSPSLSEGQREALLRNLAPYLDRQGILHLVSSASRSQHENRQEVMDRLARLLRQGLKRRRRRIPTQLGIDKTQKVRGSCLELVQSYQG